MMDLVTKVTPLLKLNLERCFLLHSILTKNYDNIPNPYSFLMFYNKKLNKVYNYWTENITKFFENDKLRETNKLMPSISQCDMLDKLDNKYREFVSQKIWFDIFDRHYNIIFNVFYTNHQKKAQENQEIRCHDIINKMQNNNQKHLVTMDGHGRFILTFFRCLKKLGLDINDYKITLVDIDLNVHRWHKLFLPKQFECIHQDIFSYLEKFKSIDKYTYLNFCSIPRGMKQKCAEVLTNAKLHLQGKLMVSFSIRSRCKDNYTKLNILTGLGLKEILTKNGADVTCQRGSFLTLTI